MHFSLQNVYKSLINIPSQKSCVHVTSLHSSTAEEYNKTKFIIFPRIPVQQVSSFSEL
uniref:Uncharacterized protein n=1 Tax=Arundo donax TaxID=35708 RepID=A0A0A9A7R1_ARUDO